MSSFVSDNDRRHSIVLVEGATYFPDWSLIYRHNVVSTDHHISHFDAIGPNFRLFPRFQPRELKTDNGTIQLVSNSFNYSHHEVDFIIYMLFNTVIKESEKIRKPIHIGTMDSNSKTLYFKNFLLQFQDRRILSKNKKK